MGKFKVTIDQTSNVVVTAQNLDALQVDQLLSLLRSVTIGA